MTEPAAAANEPAPCEKCGRVHVGRNGQPSCSAHVRRGEGDERILLPCGNYPMHGARVCRFHGGGAAHVQAAAARRRAESAMDRVVRLVTREVDERHRVRSPDEQLLEEVGRSAQVVEWLAERVAELNVPRPDDGPLARVEGIDEAGEPIVTDRSWDLFGPDHSGDAAPHIFWAKLDQERDRHARMCKLAIDAGISERLVRIAESQGQQIVSVIVSVIDGLGLTATQRETARRLAAQRLRELGPGGRVVEASR